MGAAGAMREEIGPCIPEDLDRTAPIFAERAAADDRS
jgi:hypothetical protein